MKSAGRITGFEIMWIFPSVVWLLAMAGSSNMTYAASDDTAHPTSYELGRPEMLCSLLSYFVSATNPVRLDFFDA
ncbi:hypothetical protein HYPSUDRAFT_37618 [Hypholoma sublateritium FD-334 SS-4]|uniref:Uncharacterized protein n=1 Tax=Hypholoma sublateritium (strain FD-334 SS-4) TaxID=945553 RepID=A0A0D2P3X3_HYPSF|nr:hypothetical protein HYPSUDRAFT_37618 [Hypholoma sublateritium FD-334 SS-4]